MSEKRRDSKGRVLRTGESQRKDGRYLYKYVDANGQSQSIYSWKLVATDKVPAGKRDCISLRDKEKEIQNDLAEGISTANRKLTVSDLYAKYVALHSNVKRNTQRNRQFTAKLLANDKIGSMNISAVKPSDAKEWAIRMDDTYSYNVINNTKRAISAAFRVAIGDGLVRKNPFEFALKTVLHDDTEERAALTEEQEKQLLEYILNTERYRPYYDAILLLLRTGLRISEFCGLTVNDLDFDNRVININHQLCYLSGTDFYIETPKSKKSIRKVPMCTEVYQTFKKVLEKRNGLQSVEIDGYSDFVFLQDDGTPYCPYHYRKVLMLMVPSYNSTHREQLPPISPHILRHTFCTRLASKNMNPKNLQYIMGHASIDITMNVYAHPSIESAQNEIANLMG